MEVSTWWQNMNRIHSSCPCFQVRASSYPSTCFLDHAPTSGHFHEGVCQADRDRLEGTVSGNSLYDLPTPRPIKGVVHYLSTSEHLSIILRSPESISTVSMMSSSTVADAALDARRGHLSSSCTRGKLSLLSSRQTPHRDKLQHL